MKKIAGLMLIFTIARFGIVQAQKVITPTAMLLDFYKQYITLSASAVDDETSVRMLQRKYSTIKLLKKLPEIIAETDADPFLKAQDTKHEYVQTLRVKQDGSCRNCYVVSYVGDVGLAKKQTVFIRLKLVKDGSGYKIDEIF